MGIKDLNLKDVYEGFGDEIVAELTVAVLKQSTSYDRITSFFNTDAFIAAAEGVDSLWERRGSMRLLLGVHDVPHDIALASNPVGLEEHIERAKNRIYVECDTLTNTLQINRIGTLAHMMTEGFLKVRVAIIQGGGTFHNKKIIFHDKDDYIAATGSQNETGAGLTRNHEELTLFRSWKQPEYAEQHLQGFNRIWNGENNKIIIKELDPSFAIEIIRRLDKNKIAEPKTKYANRNTLNIFHDIFKNSKEYWFFNIANAALYPHQERAIRETISGWPIRMLLSDEVGLGKTLEAASVINFSTRYLGVSRVVIFTPAGLRRQWQAELFNLFGLESYIYDAATKSFLNKDGIADYSHDSSSNPLDSAPGILIVSWQLARTSWFEKDWMNTTTCKPDLVVVDEAHSARRRPRSNGGFETTKVWEFINSFKNEINHLLLLTATPMQLYIEEYHGLLMLLGLQDWWSSPKNFKTALSALNNDSDSGLQTVSDLSNAIAASLINIQRSEEFIPNHLLPLSEELRLEPTIASKIRMQNELNNLKQLTLYSSPMRCMTVRNTKKALQNIGYTFPNRIFDIPDLDIGRNGRQFLAAIDHYLTNFHGNTEEELGLTQGRGKSFIRSVYHQRLISSFASAERTLERRKLQLEQFINTNSWKGEMYADDDFDSEELMDSDARIIPTQSLVNAKRYAQVEITVIDDVAGNLSNAKTDGDPKVGELIRIIQTESEKINQQSILIFSKFTDTLDHCIADLLNAGVIANAGYAKYTGQESYIYSKGIQSFVDKNELCSALRNGDIKYVFCSDAASEGLNLQSASIIINIDVPWNPARLEQRIGRIARLGQKALEVRIVNLWYPGTPEQQVYSRLMERLDLYNLAVGEFPDIIGDSIRNIIDNESDFIFTQIVNRINRLREDSDINALGKIWAINTNESVGQAFRNDICSFVTDSLQMAGVPIIHNDGIFEFNSNGQKIRYSAEPGLPESLTSNHSALNYIFKNCFPISPEALNGYYVTFYDERPEYISQVGEDGDIKVLSPSETIKLLRNAMLGEDAFITAIKINEQDVHISLSDSLRYAFTSRPAYGAYSSSPIDDALPDEFISHRPIINIFG